MSVPTVNTEAQQPHRRPVSRPRFRLKPIHQSCGFVQGGWWPRSTRLGTELPALLSAVTSRCGPVERVRYHEGDWSTAPARIGHAGAKVVLAADGERQHVITLCGDRFGTLSLLVIPPYTDHDEAYAAVTAAARADDASTPEKLLGISPRQAMERRHARLALHRWESEGGALPAAALSLRR